MYSSIRSLCRLAFANQDQEFEIVETGVEEVVDLGSGVKDSMLPNMKANSLKWSHVR